MQPSQPSEHSNHSDSVKKRRIYLTDEYLRSQSHRSSQQSHRSSRSHRHRHHHRHRSPSSSYSDSESSEDIRREQKRPEPAYSKETVDKSKNNDLNIVLERLKMINPKSTVKIEEGQVIIQSPHTALDSDQRRQNQAREHRQLFFPPAKTDIQSSNALNQPTIRSLQPQASPNEHHGTFSQPIMHTPSISPPSVSHPSSMSTDPFGLDSLRDHVSAPSWVPKPKQRYQQDPSSHHLFEKADESVRMTPYSSNSAYQHAQQGQGFIQQGIPQMASVPPFPSQVSPHQQYQPINQHVHPSNTPFNPIQHPPGGFFAGAAPHPPQFPSQPPPSYPAYLPPQPSPYSSVYPASSPYGVTAQQLYKHQQAPVSLPPPQPRKEEHRSKRKRTKIVAKTTYTPEFQQFKTNAAAIKDFTPRGKAVPSQD
ncbi:hypothetical protein BLNAU_3666 [Blattamonas nauphoetae]|uniref:Uncharacterized protein n=1 Tax=Blattamonas nauphoetae TaxID=2049346 RepID=A0ABQ9YC01_9EUKA|nr:hypothetical protein BLNAU_3666 [Blattamonas nauphoetae]